MHQAKAQMLLYGENINARSLSNSTCAKYKLMIIIKKNNNKIIFFPNFQITSIKIGKIM